MLYEFELGHNARNEGAVDHSAITREFKKFGSGYKNHDDQARSGRPKIVLQAMEANPASSTQRVSGELSIAH